MSDNIETAMTEEIEKRRTEALAGARLFSDPVDLRARAISATAELQEFWAPTGLAWTDFSPLIRVRGSSGGAPHLDVFYFQTFYNKADYYAFMSLAGGCKDPFCDPACAVKLEPGAFSGKPTLLVGRSAHRGDLVARMHFECKLPDRILDYLKRKGIVQAGTKEEYGVVCPTEVAA